MRKPLIGAFLIEVGVTAACVLQPIGAKETLLDVLATYFLA